MSRLPFALCTPIDGEWAKWNAAKGMRYFVTDSNSMTFHATVAAGGANNVGVTCDGTNWYIS